jgi:hypothetical protein
MVFCFEKMVFGIENILSRAKTRDAKTKTVVETANTMVGT